MWIQVEVSSETSLVKTLIGKGCPEALEILIQVVILKLKILLKKKTSEHPSGISVTNTAREKPSRKRQLEADSENEVSEKEDDEYVDFKRFFEVPKHDGFK